MIYCYAVIVDKSTSLYMNCLASHRLQLGSNKHVENVHVECCSCHHGRILYLTVLPGVVHMQYMYLEAVHCEAAARLLRAVLQVCDDGVMNILLLLAQEVGRHGIQAAVQCSKSWQDRCRC